MLSRKIYQLSRDEKEVWIYLRDQARWIERARILEVEGELVSVRYETEDEYEVAAWEEVLRIDSIGSIARRISSIRKGEEAFNELPTALDCHASELLEARIENASEQEEESPKAKPHTTDNNPE